MAIFLVVTLFAAPAPPARPLAITPGYYVFTWSGCKWQAELDRGGVGYIWRGPEDYWVSWSWDRDRRVLGMSELRRRGGPFAWEVQLDEDGCGTARTPWGLATELTIWRDGPLP